MKHISVKYLRPCKCGTSPTLMTESDILTDELHAVVYCPKCDLTTKVITIPDDHIKNLKKESQKAWDKLIV